MTLWLDGAGLMQLVLSDGGHLKLVGDDGVLTGTVRSPRRGGGDGMTLLRSIWGPH